MPSLNSPICPFVLAIFLYIGYWQHNYSEEIKHHRHLLRRLRYKWLGARHHQTWNRPIAQPYHHRQETLKWYGDAIRNSKSFGCYQLEQKKRQTEKLLTTLLKELVDHSQIVRHWHATVTCAGSWSCAQQLYNYVRSWDWWKWWWWSFCLIKYKEKEKNRDTA